MKEKTKKVNLLPGWKKSQKEATAMVDGQKNKSVIIITTESDEDGTLAMIAIAGQGGELAKGVSELATSKEAKPVFSHGLELAKRKIAERAFESFLEDVLSKK